MLLRTVLKLFVPDEESAPEILAGNMSTAMDQTLIEIPQMTNPSHQAPIHRGSLLSMPGSECTQRHCTDWI